MGKIEHSMCSSKHERKVPSVGMQSSGRSQRLDLGAADFAVQAFTVCGSVTLPHRCGRLGCAALPPRDV